ncbi:MAG: hypothetical protein IJU91_10305 [Selenomonadaceae bacterium]|nr:hypothetical protein [Selenomonadaceae bacterium]
MSTKIEQAVMKNFTKALSGSVKTGTAKIDEAIKVSTKFDSLQDVIDNMVSDCAKANSGDGGSAEKFMSEYCGITNQNNGTFNSNRGYYLYDNKTYKDLLPQEGDAVYPADTTFDANGLTVNILDLSDIKETGATLSDETKNNLVPNEQLVIKGAYSWWLKDAAKLVEDTYNVDFNGEEIDFGFEYNTESDRGAVTNSKGIRVNLAPERAATKVTEDNLHYDYDPYHLAVLLAHEMTHVAQYNFNQITREFPRLYRRRDESHFLG